jgi:hypothetical protein
MNGYVGDSQTFGIKGCQQNPQFRIRSYVSKENMKYAGFGSDSGFLESHGNDNAL